MPRRARGIEIKSGPPCVCVCVLLRTHTFHLFHLLRFLFTFCLAPSLYSCFFLDSILFYGNSYCPTDSVMCIYCSICEIGGTGRQAHYYSITGAGRFHQPWAVPDPDGGVASRQADCYIAPECQPSPPRQRSTRHVLNNRECNWLQSGSVSERIPVRAELHLPRWCLRTGQRPDPIQGPLWLNRRTHTHCKDVSKIWPPRCPFSQF